jgi:hypothetical protein
MGCIQKEKFSEFADESPTKRGKRRLRPQNERSGIKMNKTSSF